MGLLKVLRRLFSRLSRHRPRRDEDLQGRPARPEVEANLQRVMVRRYADRTKETATPRRKHFDNRRRSYMRSHWEPRGRFGNPRWMRAEGVTPLGVSSGVRA